MANKSKKKNIQTNIFTQKNRFNMASDAVGLEVVSRVVGYKLTKGDFSTSSPNLPQRVVIFAEANTANQADLDTGAYQITSAQKAGKKYGYGSPIHIISRILFPIAGGGVGAIPVFVHPQEEQAGATAKVVKIEPSGTATANGTHTIYIGGRNGVDGQFYDINIVNGDTTADITGKIYDAISNVLGSPVTAIDYDYDVRLTTKWKGLTANDLVVSVDDNDVDLGITYAVSTLQSAIGTPSVQPALDLFGSNWNTIVVNSYTASSVLNTLEAFNGIPGETPTGRYTGIIMKPFIALTGSVANDPSADTDARKNNCTIAICPAPLSAGLPMEAAANMAVLFARVSQDTPHLDVSGKSYPDMPTPLSIGDMADFANRNTFVKKGCSTVDLSNGVYVVQDFVTTYHPEGEMPAQFAYCRNLMIDFNVRFAYYLREQVNVVDHTIAADDDIVSASNVIKPTQWKQIVKALGNDLAKRAIIADVAFMQDSIVVNLSTVNPDRLETFFRYKRTGFARVSATTAEAGFNFGNV